MKLGPTHSVLLYDPATGYVRQTYHQLTVAGAPAPDKKALEYAARKAASKHQLDQAQLATLHSETLDLRAAYRVDVQKRVPIEVSKPDRSNGRAK